MSSERGALEPASAADSGPACDRCGDPIRGERAFRLSSEPSPALADRYEPVSRSYCPDCVAAVGMLAFAPAARARSPTRSE
ncbi:hypothetical protein [Natrarchaeobius oligotrophus]|nr:hypothetical protein [Natrarchaeobius chitinivorans]